MRRCAGCVGSADWQSDTLGGDMGATTAILDSDPTLTRQMFDVRSELLPTPLVLVPVSVNGGYHVAPTFLFFARECVEEHLMDDRSVISIDTVDKAHLYGSHDRQVLGQERNVDATSQRGHHVHRSHFHLV